MKTIKTMLKSISDYFRQIGGRYPLTALLILLVSLSAALFIDQSNAFANFMENQGLSFLVLWGFGAFFAETFLSGRRGAKWAAAAAAAVLSGVLVYFRYYSAEPLKTNAGHWNAACGIVFAVLGTWRNYKKSGQLFNTWCIRVVHELSRLAIICAVTAAGLALVTATFVALILNGQHYMLVFRAEFLVLGCLLGSGVLYAQIRPERERPAFFNVIVRYLLTGLLTAAFVIVYLYILKIIITRVMPSNEVFRILAGLFIIGLPIWTLAGTYDEKDPLIRIAVRLPYLFIPFLFLQGYAIRQRIAAYGLTPLRYLCLVLMLFEVIYIIVYAARKRETGIMLPVIAVLAVICLAVPSMSVRSQKAILDRGAAAGFAGLSREDQSSVAGAYYYLASDPEGKLLLTDTDPALIAAIESSGMIGEPDFDRNISVYLEFPVSGADISGFTSLSRVSTWLFKPESAPEGGYDPNAIVFYGPDGSPLLTADLSAFIDECISAQAADPVTAQGPDGILRISENRMILLDHCSFTAETDGTYRWMDLGGVLLEK